MTMNEFFLVKIHFFEKQIIKICYVFFLENVSPLAYIIIIILMALYKIVAN
jgi:hypothetical protein